MKPCKISFIKLEKNRWEAVSSNKEFLVEWLKLNRLGFKQPEKVKQVTNGKEYFRYRVRINKAEKALMDGILTPEEENIIRRLYREDLDDRYEKLMSTLEKQIETFKDEK